MSAVWERPLLKRERFESNLSKCWQKNRNILEMERRYRIFYSGNEEILAW